MRHTSSSAQQLQASRSTCARAAEVVTLAAGLLFAVVLVGCGSGSSGSTASASSSPAPSASVVAGATITPDPSLKAMLPSNVQSANAVTVASDVPYPPFEMYVSAGSKDLTGFDYDLGQALGAKIGIPFSFSQVTFDSIIPSLQSGKYNISMTAMIDTKERQAVLDFVDYVNTGSVLLVKKGNPSKVTTLESLSGKVAATESGTVQAQLYQAANAKLKSQGKPVIKVLEFKKVGESLLALQSGKAVAEFTTFASAAYIAETTNGGSTFELVHDPAAPNGYDPSQLGIGMIKGSTQLRDTIQKALQMLIDDGTYAKILAKYGFDSIGVTSAQVNQGK